MPVAEQAFLALLASGPRSKTPLTAAEEALLDTWSAGTASAAEGAAAEQLVRSNSLAAERILERKLLAAAASSPAAPPSLSAKVLRAHTPAKEIRSGFAWPSFARWQWSGIGGAFAAATIVMVVGLQFLQTGGVVQVALVSISDRSLVFEPNDVRMRSAQGATLTAPVEPGAGQPGAAQGAQTTGRPAAVQQDARYRDVSLPASLIAALVQASSEDAKKAAVRSLQRLLGAAESDRQPVFVAVDNGLKARTSAAAATIPVRVYNLRHSQAASIRDSISGVPRSGSAYLLTYRY